jgi:ABC-type lipoprotein release transport system permease subunit
VSGAVILYHDGLASDKWEMSVDALRPVSLRTWHPAALYTAAVMRLRVLTYNIHRALALLSAYFHVHVVLSAIVAERDGLVGVLRTVKDHAGHGFSPVVAYADVVERLAVAVVDLE